ncbi:MAG: DNA translocase FtsK, partial [Phaeodactylibacter sp.]|nr:DNA translocase FtsK [Phaeodactylibacter sp.]
IQRAPLVKMLPSLRTGLLLLVFFSIFLGFVFQNAEFPWGGAFGKSVSLWMKGFVGTAGMILLFLFLGIGLVVWFTNPNFKDMTARKAAKDIKYWTENNVLSRTKPAPATAETKQTVDVKEQPKALRPGERHQDMANGSNGQAPGKDKTPPTREEREQQLAFELEEVKRRQEQRVQKPSDAELEIEKGAQGPGASAPPINPTLSIEAQEQNHTEPYDPTLELSSYEHPVLALLNDYDDQRVEIDRTELEANKDQIIETLLNYKIEITKIRATIGPTVTLYEIVPAAGVRISKIKNLEDDIALSLAALGIRIIAPIPGRGTIGIEVPNKKKQIVSLKEVLMSDKFKRAKMNLPIALGKTISNEVFVVDLTKMPHLLIAGATGQGKSVGINTIIMSLIYKKHPSQVKLVMIDPKKVELFPYARLDRHFLAFLPGQDEPITTETNRVINVLNSLCIEMDQRYDLLKKASARNIREYNDKFVQRRLNPQKGHRFLPF